jgi:hypothetical protein
MAALTRILFARMGCQADGIADGTASRIDTTNRAVTSLRSALCSAHSLSRCVMAMAPAPGSLAPLRRGARVGLTKNYDIITRPVTEMAGILRSPCDDASSLSREVLSSFTSRSPPIRRDPKGAGALRLLQASSAIAEGHLPPTEAPAALGYCASVLRPQLSRQWSSKSSSARSSTDCNLAHVRS